MPLRFFHPRFWLTWLGIAILRLLILLPWHWQMSIGATIGKLLYKALPSRRKVSCINIEIAFPELSPEKREEINRQHFISLGESLFSTALSWWGSNSQIDKVTQIEGLENLLNAQKEGGVILVGVHFTSLELGGRIVSNHTYMEAVYRPHKNELLEYLTTQKRSEHYGKTISKHNIKDMVKGLKKGKVVWYATDQNYRGKNSVPIPFFGIDTATNTGTSRLSKMTGAKVIPMFPMRLPGKNKGYLLRIYPALSDFPSNDSVQDTLRLNQIIEEQIKEHPEQYLWTHKRYKHYASESKDFYKDYLLNNETSCS